MEAVWFTTSPSYLLEDFLFPLMPLLRPILRAPACRLDIF